MINQLVAKHELVVVGRFSNERLRCSPWNEPFNGVSLREIERFDCKPIFKAYAGVDGADVEAWVLEAMESEVLRALRLAAERGDVFWPRKDLSLLSGSTSDEAVNGQLAIIRNARRSDLKLYAFSIYSQYIMFFAKPGWENVTFFSADAQEIFERYATGVKKYLDRQKQRND